MDEIIGFETQKAFFRSVFERNGLAHAYLFTGPDMIGKRAFALALARTLNPASLDLLTNVRMVTPDTEQDEVTIGVEVIRDIAPFLALRVTPHTTKCVIIDGAERLTLAAVNALLKILEEPPAHSVFFLISPTLHTLAPTIISRCQRVTFHEHPQEVLVAELTKRGISPDHQQQLLEVAGGRLGWLLDTLNNDQTAPVIASLDRLRQALRADLATRFALSKEVAEQTDCRRTLELWLRWLRGNMHNPDRAQGPLHSLLAAYELCSEPQFNHRLALDRFFASF